MKQIEEQISMDSAAVEGLCEEPLKLQWGSATVVKLKHIIRNEDRTMTDELQWK